jgi:uncharacterized protein (TIGR03435 family)
MRGVTLQYLIAVANRVRPQVVVGPDWLAETRFDLEALVAEDIALSAANEMLLNLLVERFELKTHVGSEERSGYLLVVGKNGAKLGVYSPKETPAADPLERMKQKKGIPGSQRTEINSWSTERLADVVSQKLKLPVEDRTGLKGKYHVVLEIGPPLDANDRDPLARTLGAVEKLGLHLKPGKVAERTIVVDHVAKVPKPN